MLSSLCPYVAPFLTVFQNVINQVFGALSFLGISAPNITSIVYSALGCTTA